MRVFEAIPELIRRSDLRVVFGLVGSANVAWVGHGVREGMLDWVRTRHEETSVAAASAYSKVTGKVGVATTTLGPGFANTVNASRPLSTTTCRSCSSPASHPAVRARRLPAAQPA